MVCFGGEDWWYHNRGHFDMQMMRRMAKRMPVLYVNSVGTRVPSMSEGRIFLKRILRKAKSLSRLLRKVEEGFHVASFVSLPFQHGAGMKLNQALVRLQLDLACGVLGIAPRVLWLACPGARKAALGIPVDAVVYQRTDNYSEFAGASRNAIAEADEELGRRADLVLVSSQVLREASSGLGDKVLLVTHGVDYDLFTPEGGDVPVDMAMIPRPIAGFFGGLGPTTFDAEFAAKAAALAPEFSFVFVGAVSTDVTALRRLPNTYFLGQRPYNEVPSYGRQFDVCIMPWQHNKWIEACNPVKMKEYLSLGKPIVSTDFPEVRAFRDFVEIDDEPAGFAEAIRRSHRENSGDRARARRESVRHETWDAKAECVWARIEAIAGARTRP